MHCTSHQILQVHMNDVQRVGMVQVQLATHNAVGLHALFDTTTNIQVKLTKRGAGMKIVLWLVEVKNHQWMCLTLVMIGR